MTRCPFLPGKAYMHLNASHSFLRHSIDLKVDSRLRENYKGMARPSHVPTCFTWQMLGWVHYLMFGCIMLNTKREFGLGSILWKFGWFVFGCLFGFPVPVSQHQGLQCNTQNTTCNYSYGRWMCKRLLLANQNSLRSKEVAVIR